MKLEELVIYEPSDAVLEALENENPEPTSASELLEELDKILENLEKNESTEATSSV